MSYTQPQNYSLSRHSVGGLVGAAVLASKSRIVPLFTTPRTIDASVQRLDPAAVGNLVMHDLPLYRMRMPDIRRALDPFGGKVHHISHFYGDEARLANSVDSAIIKHKFYAGDKPTAEILADRLQADLPAEFIAMCGYIDGFSNTPAMLRVAKHSDLERTKQEGRMLELALAHPESNVFRSEIVSQLADGIPPSHMREVQALAYASGKRAEKFKAGLTISQAGSQNITYVNGPDMPFIYRLHLLRGIHEQAPTPVTIMRYDLGIPETRQYLFMVKDLPFSAGELSEKVAAELDGAGSGTMHIGAGVIPARNTIKLPRVMLDTLVTELMAHSPESAQLLNVQHPLQQHMGLNSNN